MKKQRTGDLKLIQQLNESVILEMIRDHGPISRSQIAKELGISPTTVTSAVNLLMAKDLVTEDGIGISSGGRKPVLLRFNPTAHSIIGVAVTNTKIAIAELDLNGNVKQREDHDTHNARGNDIVELLLEKLERFVQKHPNLLHCQGISVVLPGIVDAQHGVVSYNSKLNLFNVPLVKLIEKKLGIPTYIDNDANSYVLSHYYFGSSAKYKNLIYITIGEGIGSGIMINGQIFRGSNGSAGEIGHTSVAPDGAVCECGGQGCLESYVSWPVIYGKIVSAVISNSTPTLIPMMTNGDINQITPAIFLKALKEGDQLCENIMKEMVRYLSTAIKDYIHLFDPEAIILSGSIVQDNHQLIEQLQEEVAKKVISNLRSKVNIQLSPVGSEKRMLGAAAILFHNKFKFRLS
ncbi:ROK family transcriptional regulator [Gracilibacillus alcaliphilus]|uniref:ROK family transcriptional regulator n=1 Tax=Gracilibacillus alcaliphilus TaxID=1401441 RepID=UPI001EF7E91D|nr:ROK family transcriptional regulator [Gracilibacillus alcaliphilus]MBM7677473.1 putative NBD/HSP70 family sugar kinase [Gracilibacillus alcaliphilus]